LRQGYLLFHRAEDQWQRYKRKRATPRPLCPTAYRTGNEPTESADHGEQRHRQNRANDAFYEDDERSQHKKQVGRSANSEVIPPRAPRAAFSHHHRNGAHRQRHEQHK
jgi:hypothetical protein